MGFAANTFILIIKVVGHIIMGKWKDTLKERWEAAKFDLELAYAGLNNFGNFVMQLGIMAVIIRLVWVNWHGDMWIKIPGMLAVLGMVISLLTHEKKKEDK